MEVLAIHFARCNCATNALKHTHTHTHSRSHLVQNYGELGMQLTLCNSIIHLANSLILFFIIVHLKTLFRAEQIIVIFN